MATTIIVTNKGLDLSTALLAASTIKYIDWGTGVTAAAATQTALVTPGNESRTTGTQSQQTTNTAADTYRVVGTMTCTSVAKAITEVGIFDANTVGNMFVRAAFSAINVDVGDSIQFTISTVLDQA